MAVVPTDHWMYRRMEGETMDEKGGVAWVSERRAVCGWASGEKAGY